MQRIAVVGTSCAGKTTLARRLAERKGFPHIELDALFWEPSWQPRAVEDFRPLVERATSESQWITDGNYSTVRDLVWTRADTLIWLNYPFRTVFTRALRRTLVRSLSRQKLFAGNQESLGRAFFSRESILLWVLQTHGKLRRDYPGLFEQPEHSHLNVIVLRCSREADQLVSQH